MGFYRFIYNLLNIEYEGSKEKKQREEQHRLKYILNKQIIETASWHNNNIQAILYEYESD